MALKAKFDIGAMKRQIHNAKERLNLALSEELKYIGEDFVNKARAKQEYGDITGNLRSSIGYISGYDGKVLHENFEEAPKGTDKATGAAKGKQFAYDVLQDYEKGFFLIVVAGMDYAKHVERGGRDVITGSAKGIKQEVRESVNRIKRKLRTT